uniref:Uncharacterized protein n=1 Tax=Panagrolaimus sp. ES5 TaxID=591445 RepID=A0AC34FQ24_9BILA
MASLNPDILEEIVSQFNMWTMEDGEKSVAAIKKFMLSGKEPYQAVLRYFSSVDSVAIDSFKLRIYIKRLVVHKDFNNDSNLYIFPFDFPFLDDILKAVMKSNTKLQVESYPFSNSGKRVLTMLLQKDLKFISLDSGRILPSDYYEFFKNECKFGNARLTLCCTKNPIPDVCFINILNALLGNLNF